MVHGVEYVSVGFLLPELQLECSSVWRYLETRPGPEAQQWN